MKNTMMKAVLSCILAAGCVATAAQSKNDPQRSDAQISLGESVTWTSILRDDDTGLRHIGQISAPERGTDRYDFWSIGCETMDRDYAHLSSYKRFLPELGAGYGRLMSGWAKTEKVRGQYDFSWLDEHVDGLAEEGVKPWMCLCYGNELYSDSGTMLFSRIISGDRTLDAWERYVEALVQRYKGKIHMYEIWNEPNFGAIYKDPEMKALAFESYKELVFRTIRAIRKFDRKTPVAAGSLATWLDYGFCSCFISYLREKGMEKELKYITFHPYGGNPEKKLGEIVALKDSLKKEAPWIELLCGEVGLKSLDVQTGNLKYNETGQAKWVLRQMAMEFGLGIPCSIFSMIDNRYPHKLQSYGMLCADLMGRALYKRPQFYCYQNMISVLDKTVKAGPALSVDIDADKQLYDVSLKKGRKVRGLLLWFGNAFPTISCDKTPVDVRVAGLKIKHPVYADMATGRVFEIADFRTTSEGMEFPGLPLWDSPVLVMEADEFRWDRVEPGKSFKKAGPAATAPVRTVTSISPEN